MNTDKIFKIIYHKMMSHVYKAKDCTDLNDIQNAIWQLKQVENYLGGIYTHEMLRRLSSLNKKELEIRNRKNDTKRN